MGCGGGGGYVWIQVRMNPCALTRFDIAVVTTPVSGGFGRGYWHMWAATVAKGCCFRIASQCGGGTVFYCTHCVCVRV